MDDPEYLNGLHLEYLGNDMASAAERTASDGLFLSLGQYSPDTLLQLWSAVANGTVSVVSTTTKREVWKRFDEDGWNLADWSCRWSSSLIEHSLLSSLIDIAV